MRHIAWLDAAPDRAEGDKSKAPTMSRRKVLETDGIEPDLPPCRSLSLVECLFEIGPTLTGSMGDSPLTHSEIRSWQKNTGITLESWETRALRRLSTDYLIQAQKAKSRTCPPPWEESGISATVLENHDMKKELRAMAQL